MSHLDIAGAREPVLSSCLVQSEAYVYLVTDICRGGTLEDFIRVSPAGILTSSLQDGAHE